MQVSLTAKTLLRKLHLIDHVAHFIVLSDKLLSNTKLSILPIDKLEILRLCVMYFVA